MVSESPSSTSHMAPLKQSNKDINGADALSPTVASQALQALKKAPTPRNITHKMAPSNKAASILQSTKSVSSNSAISKANGRIKDEHLRIQAPTARGTGVRETAGAAFSGLASGSAASVVSEPISPADDGLDTPDGSSGGSESSTKRRRVVCDGNSGVSVPASVSPPLFLEKSYEMLDKCSPHVACWSPSGDSFIVKNPSEFAEHVIPIYFKHKNFSSFVRQLNFYGFRKVRVVDPDITGGVDPKDWWEFRHEKFLRGRKDLLKEIKRRSMPSSSSTAFAGSGLPSGNNEAAARASADRAEIDELRNEVLSLKEQIQTLNKHMYSVMQIMMMRNNNVAVSAGAGFGLGLGLSAGPTVSGFASPHVSHPHQLPPQYSFISGLPPAYPVPQVVQSDFVPTKNEQRGMSAPPISAPPPPTSYAPYSSGYPLRPLQSIVGSGMPPGGYSPALVTTPVDTSHAIDWDVYARHAFHGTQAVQPPQPARIPAQQPSPPDVASSLPAAVGLKRSRSQQPQVQARTQQAPLHTPRSSPSSDGSGSSSASGSNLSFLNNPDAAVRRMSLLATQIRDELLQSIISRTLGYVRAQPPATSGPSDNKMALRNNTPQIDVVAIAVGGDIQLKLGRINEAEAATQGLPPSTGDSSSGSTNSDCITARISETSHMYRVEILKFVSKELPRAMQDAVDKKLPPQTKKCINRSLLALLVQRAQAALEQQMRVETSAASATSPK